MTFQPPLNPHIKDLQAYTPGEQLNDPKVIKLNTNECPFPPSKSVLEAVRSVGADALRKYPNPTCEPLRKAIAADLDLTPDRVLVGNGSDEILRLIVHAFVPAGERIATLRPTYSLYPVLGEMFGGRMEEHPAGPEATELPEAFITSDAPLKFLPNPNPPYGRLFAREQVERLLAESRGLVILDEAYVAFAEWSGAPLLRTHENLIVTRTFSKSHALAGMRVGFALASASLIERMDAIRDSYNINVVSQAAALAAWNDKAWLASAVADINSLRAALTGRLRELGFQVSDSRGNFVFAEHRDAVEIAAMLKRRKILVRHFRTPELERGLRISIGTPDETRRLLEAIDSWLSSRETTM